MKRFVPFVLVFGLITGLSCSSDDGGGGGEAASMTRSAGSASRTRSTHQSFARRKRW